MKVKNIIWGLVLVLIGVLFILKNLEIIYFSWWSIWRLWPIALVLIGIAILPIKDSIKVILTIVVLLIGAYFLVTAPHENRWYDRWPFHRYEDWGNESSQPEQYNQKISEDYDTVITEAKLSFDAAAGNFRISQKTDELFEFDREGNVGKYNYSIKDLGPKREINIELQDGHVIGGNFKNKVSMSLNPNPIWDISVDVGAASIDLDMADFKVSNLDIDGGASSINIRIGKLLDECKLKINSGASSIDIKIPEEFACEVNTSTVLSSKDLKGFNKVSGGTYVTPDFSDKSKNIVIDIEAAVSSLNVERYK